MNVHMKHILGAFALCFALVLAGCEGGAEPEEAEMQEPATGMEMDQQMDQETAVARIEPTAGNEVTGTVTFTSMDGQVRVEGSLSGLSEGMHGFHVHQNGDCSNDAQAAGGHFNPQNSPHGAPDAAANERHVGDLGNIEADADGHADIMMTDSLLAFSGQNSIVGKAVVVHGGQDDLTSQPSGDAGARVGCGVIELEGGGMDAMTDTTAMGGM